MNRRRLLLLSAMALMPACGTGTALASDKKDNPNATYVAMPAATGVIPRRDGRRSTLTVELGLEIPDRTLRDHAQLSRPRLVAAYNEIVRTTARGLLPGRVPDLDILTRSLQTSTNRILGKPGAKVLLGSVIVL